MRIGIDFDNTLVSYDDAFLRLARERGLLPECFSGSKKDVRDTIRAEAGDGEWMKLQAEVYGRRMAEAQLIEGARDFIAACRRNGVPVHIVSHKTQYAAADPGGADLHMAALSWMENSDFFGGMGLQRSDIFFEPTREAKCRRVDALGCSHFIDDLEEVFQEPNFPAGVHRFLLHRGDGPSPRGPFTALPNWAAITEAVFNHGR